MNFWKRLRLYLIGFGIGILVVIVIFNQRLSLLTSWMPGQRVQDRLLLTEALYTDRSLCQLSCLGIDTADVRTAKELGDIRFRLSETHSDPKVYVLDASIKEDKYRFTFDALDSSSVLTNAECLNRINNCSCDDEFPS